MIVFKNVCKSYPGSPEILQNINLEILPGELVFVTGPSGAGKTTLLKLISALEKPSSGSIVFESQDLSQIKDKDIPILRRRFGMIFQDHKLLYDRDCFKNVALPLKINNMTKADTYRRVRAALDKVDLLQKERIMPITLSGGEQQRLAIARAIVSRPSILIADEPTANLDKEYAEEIMNIFYSFQQVGVTVIISTHELPSTKINFKRLQLNGGAIQNLISYDQLP
ncbi:MAG: ATP-binding cassette domain-containing protein [Nitrosomonadales bacterium]|jgi:cell division transport system ATP-binding protein|nr:ATP-binding cassette domain-containing protein [Nitrosomonadales bacterium]MBT4182582.1 ATP-binding cassette domain-containing protein [Nitrosomonadales bacterium]MBT4570655.1 ATP-binding cassette domain-containing protein [Nitrosomonadales bacterium]MBT5149738.1 ATP-binding cassette domain-containing protein [Nitrosomonadales bacterium]MBT5573727.1 ATP-binding cassette domain-containing protein [Nitrosomonadales bacterium]